MPVALGTPLHTVLSAMKRLSLKIRIIFSGHPLPCSISVPALFFLAAGEPPLGRSCGAQQVLCCTPEPASQLSVKQQLNALGTVRLFSQPKTLKVLVDWLLAT